ncbi:MAG: DUF4380 domain-containing protein [Polyangiaceae bacterium]
MAGSSARRCLACLFGGLVVWSCAATSGPQAVNGSGGTSAEGGAHPEAGESSNDVGEAGSSQPAGEQPTAGSGLGLGGSAAGENSGAGTSSSPEAGGAADCGMGGATAAEAGASGSADGGAGGSADSRLDFDGRCDGWAADADAAAPGPNLQGNITPQADSAGNWSFVFGRYRLVVAGSHGARVTEFSIDGSNLIDATEGSTFWPSPQQAYPWPPPVQLDSASYTSQSDSASLTLTSAIAPTLGLRVRKRFWANAASGVVSIEYQLVNESKLSAAWAPWEVTRVNAGGYTFAPRGPGNRTIIEDSWQYPLPMSLLPPPPAAGSINWLDYASLKLTEDNYITEFDGAEGWLAHADRFGKALLPVLFVKSFVDAPDASLPPNQAEVQLWTSGTAKPKLIEVEQQGALQELAPGDSLSWTVHWSACELPSSSLLAAGNLKLAAFARAHAIDRFQRRVE